MLEDGRGIADYAPKSEQGAIAGIKIRQFPPNAVDMPSCANEANKDRE
jgi:hypothetical protein